MSKYTVRHYRINPRRNTTILLDRKADAINEMRRYSGDRQEESSALEVDGMRVAVRGWEEKRITWLTTTPRQTYKITSGEGTGQGTTEIVVTTDLGIKRRLAKERCGGDRWAFVCDEDDNRLDF
jgi:hypothetical protein